MRRYSYQDKLEAVRAYLSGHVGLREVAKRHTVDVTALRSWIAAYRLRGESGLKPKQRVPYSAEFKVSVLHRMRRETLSYRQVAALFDIRRFALVGTWQRQYDTGGFAALIPKYIMQPHNDTQTISQDPTDQHDPEPPAESLTKQALVDEVNYLRAENAYLKKLGALVHTNTKPAQSKKP